MITKVQHPICRCRVPRIGPQRLIVTTNYAMCFLSISAIVRYVHPSILRAYGTKGAHKLSLTHNNNSWKVITPLFLNTWTLRARQNRTISVTYRYVSTGRPLMSDFLLLPSTRYYNALLVLQPLLRIWFPHIILRKCGRYNLDQTQTEKHPPVST